MGLIVSIGVVGTGLLRRGGQSFILPQNSLLIVVKWSLRGLKIRHPLYLLHHSITPFHVLSTSAVSNQFVLSTLSGNSAGGTGKVYQICGIAVSL